MIRLLVFAATLALAGCEKPPPPAAPPVAAATPMPPEVEYDPATAAKMKAPKSRR